MTDKRKIAAEIDSARPATGDNGPVVIPGSTAKKAVKALGGTSDSLNKAVDAARGMSGE